MLHLQQQQSLQHAEALAKTQEANQEALRRLQGQFLAQQFRDATRSGSVTALASAMVLNITLSLAGGLEPECEAALRAFCTNIDSKSPEEAKAILRVELRSLGALSAEVDAAMAPTLPAVEAVAASQASSQKIPGRSGRYFCSHCGPGSSHATEKCWALQGAEDAANGDKFKRRRSDEPSRGAPARRY